MFNLIPKGLWRFFVYIIFLASIKVFIEHDHHVIWVSIFLSLVLIIPEYTSDYSPKFLAFLFINKLIVICSVIIVCSLFFTYSYIHFNMHCAKNATRPNLMSSTEFILEGALLGYIIRTLLIHYFYQIIRAKDVFPTKVLIMLVYLVLLFVFPFNHRQHICFYSLGLGIGFLIHYLIRLTERRNAQYVRLSKNLLFLIEDMKGGYKLSVSQVKAIKFYAKQNWKKLKKMLSEIERDEIFFYIELSMLRKRHEYTEALGLLSIYETNPPDWFTKYKHFYHLHSALNKHETDVGLTKPDGNSRILNDLHEAINLKNQCLLSNTTLALVIANDISLSDTSPENEKKKKESLDIIWKSMKIYEKREDKPQLVFLLSGMTIPFTYSFLLDTYGYVLFKNGFFKFSEALFIQCLYQDPSFSATYLHLAEYYIHSLNRDGVADNYKDLYKAAALNLRIVINNENLDNIGGHDSYITKKARKLLDKLEKENKNR